MKHPFLTLIAVLSLAIGIGANTAIFTYVTRILVRSLPVEDPDRLVTIFCKDAKVPDVLRPISRPNFLDFKESNDVFTSIVSFRPVGLRYIQKDRADILFGEIVSIDYFDVLGVKAAHGRTFLPEEGQAPGAHPVIVLSHDFWQRQFSGDPGVVGQTLNLNNTMFTVIGVAQKGFNGPHVMRSAELWVPSAMYEQVLFGRIRGFWDRRDALSLNVIGRMKPGVGYQQAEAAVRTLGARLVADYPEENEDLSFEVLPSIEAAIDPPEDRTRFNKAGAFVMGVVGMVLLIACSNVASLLLGQAVERRKEVAMRLALGANRGRVIRQLLTESLLLCLVGGAGGLLLGVWIRNIVWAYKPPYLADALSIGLDPWILGFTLLLSLATGVLFGLVPALRASRSDLVTALKVQSTPNVPGAKGLRLQYLPLVLQITLSLAALIGVGLFVRSLSNAYETDLGWDPDGLFVMWVNLGTQGYDDNQGQSFYQRVGEEIESVPGVEKAAVSSRGILAEGFNSQFLPQGMGEESQVLVNYFTVDPDYFETVRLPLLRGRNFTEADQEGDPMVLIVNENVANRFWPDGDAIGQQVSFSEIPFEIVGVAKNATYSAIGEEDRLYAYVSLRQDYVGVAGIHVRAHGDPKATIDAVRAKVGTIDRTLPLVNVETAKEVINRLLWGTRAGVVMLGILGALAILLAAIGIYGTMAYAVRHRTREIGIRKALGASRHDVLARIFFQGMLPVAVGIVLGVFVAIFATRWIESLLFDVATVEPVVYVAAIVVLALVAAAANLLSARKVMAIEPVVALHDE